MAVLGARFFLCLLAIYSLSACGVGNAYDYRSVSPTLKTSSSRSLSIGVLDRRPYVLSNDKSPSFAGLVRSAAGIPWSVYTLSGVALADEFAAVIARGYKAKVAQFPVRTPEDKVISRLRSSGASRLLLVTVFEWKTDTYVNVALYYNLLARIYDSSGKMLAENRVSGKDNLGPVLFPTEVGPLATTAAKRKFEQLLNAPNIQQSLQ